MSDYRRLTERSDNGIAIKDTSTNDNKSIWNEIERLAELEDKIENGTLHELPCKVGDKVYQLDNAGDIYESEIKCLIYVTSHIAFDERSIGTSIFLTKEQAEARLKELDNSYKENGEF